MSYSTYLTKVSLAGTKASVVKLLNAAIKNVGNGETITPEDTIETIKYKFILTDEEGNKSWLRILFHDSNQVVEVVEQLPEEIVLGKVLFDGIFVNK